MTQKSNQVKQGLRGFTIVELLIVIVVIGILAAITVVAYSGITSRARTTKAQTAASNVQKVAEAFNADNGRYPSTIAEFTTNPATNPSTKLPSGLQVVGTTTAFNALTAAQKEAAVIFESCGATATPAASAVTGGRIQYYDFSLGEVSSNYIYVGTGQAAIGASTPCVAWAPAA